MSKNLFVRWFSKGLIFSLLLLATSTALLVFLPPAHYGVGNPEGKIKLLESTPGPRLIIVGGSNVALGQDSEQLSVLINRAVVNDGLIAPLGIRVILNLLDPHVRTGDVIVISAEYEHFFGDAVNGWDQYLGELLYEYPQAIKAFEWPQYKRLPNILRTLFQIRLLGFTDGSPANSSILYNRYGDMILPAKRTDLPAISNDAVIQQDSAYNPVAVDVLNRFAAQARAKGATVVFVYSAVRMTNCMATGAHLEQFDTYLRSHLEFPILSHPRDSCFADEYFYDSQFHLNMDGRKLRTLQLAQWLNQAGILH